MSIEPIKKRNKQRLFVDFAIFILSIAVVLFAKIEDRYHSMMIFIPIVVFINFCLSFYRFKRQNREQ